MQVFDRLSVAEIRAKDLGTMILSYTGTGIDLFGYYVPTHKDVTRAIKEYQENCLARTGCNLELDVISWSSVESL